MCIIGLPRVIIFRVFTQYFWFSFHVHGRISLPYHVDTMLKVQGASFDQAVGAELLSVTSGGSFKIQCN